MKMKEASSDCLVQDDVVDDDHLLLSRLLSQLESLKGDGAIKEAEASTEIEEVSSAAVGNVERKNDGTEEIVKELKKLKKQNFVTHCLLSVMIVLTVAWQLSEVSLILKVRDGLKHPFRSFGGLLGAMLKGPDTNGQDAEKQSSKQLIEGPTLPSINIPELPHVEFLDLGLNGDNN